MLFTIRRQKKTDLAFISRLVADAFGPERKTRTVYQFRKAIEPIESLSFIAHTEKKLVGSIQFWPVRMPDGQIFPLLGPLAVWPELRGKGVGRALIQTGLDAAKSCGYPAVLIVGDPGYYASFGFGVEPVEQLQLTGPVTPLVFLGIEFNLGALGSQSGTIMPVTAAIPKIKPASC